MHRLTILAKLREVVEPAVVAAGANYVEHHVQPFDAMRNQQPVVNLELDSETNGTSNAHSALNLTLAFNYAIYTTNDATLEHTSRIEQAIYSALFNAEFDALLSANACHVSYITAEFDIEAADVGLRKTTARYELIYQADNRTMELAYSSDGSEADAATDDTNTDTEGE